MTPAWSSALVAAGIAAVLAFLLHRRSREARALRERLESATSDLEHLQRSFGRFAPEEIVERVIARGVSTGGERKEVTALFADLVGYTALSERLDPDVLVRILNGYFERMSRAITEHRGHVSALIGDGMLALFGALEPDPWQANGAVRAALAMREELEAYNRRPAAARDRNRAALRRRCRRARREPGPDPVRVRRAHDQRRGPRTGPHAQLRCRHPGDARAAREPRSALPAARIPTCGDSRHRRAGRALRGRRDGGMIRDAVIRASPGGVRGAPA
jgi:class 3 adenylate cyclase